MYLKITHLRSEPHATGVYVLIIVIYSLEYQITLMIYHNYLHQCLVMPGHYFGMVGYVGDYGG